MNAGRRRVPGGAIYDDGLWTADHGTPELVRGYVVLKPRRHVESLADLTSDEAAALGVALRRLHAAVERALQPDRIYVLGFGESVRHVHLHLMPRYSGMPATGPQLIEQLFDEAWLCTETEAALAADAIRSALTT